MITALIFFIHLLFPLIIFVKKWQSENITTALLNVGLIGLLFAVGWSITGMFARAVMDEKGFGLHFDRDTFSLVLLIIAEFFFYKMYYKEDFTEAGKGKQ